MSKHGRSYPTGMVLGTYDNEENLITFESECPPLGYWDCIYCDSRSDEISNCPNCGAPKKRSQPTELWRVY